ncbi:MAG: ABC transporter permease [Methylacidiphilales bacterium]|nr:ABC transporter permease [Candidatus Methylacidiphilales bacterium]MDW8348813.1 ABC transporter permease [Verrucomicrobiae bacterium]
MSLIIQFQKELKDYFVQPLAYIILFVTALLIGLGMNFMIILINDMNLKEFTVLEAYMNGPFFWIALLIQTPFITMRLFAEEYKLGTIEMLMTAPIRAWEVVLAKFLAALTFFIIIWLPMLANLFLLQIFGQVDVLQSWAYWILPYLFLLLWGSAFIAVGLFFSSITKNQIIASISSFCVTFAFFLMGFLPYLKTVKTSADFNNYFSVFEQIDGFLKAVLDTRPIVLYLSITLLFLTLTQRALESRRLNS